MTMSHEKMYVDGDVPDVRMSEVVSENRDWIRETMLDLWIEALNYDDHGSTVVVMIDEDGYIDFEWFTVDATDLIPARVWEGSAVEVGRVKPVNISEWVLNQVKGYELDDLSGEDLTVMRDKYVDEHRERIIDEIDDMISEAVMDCEAGEAPEDNFHPWDEY